MTPSISHHLCSSQSPEISTQLIDVSFKNLNSRIWQHKYYTEDRSLKQQKYLWTVNNERESRILPSFSAAHGAILRSWSWHLTDFLANITPGCTGRFHWNVWDWNTNWLLPSQEWALAFILLLTVFYSVFVCWLVVFL